MKALAFGLSDVGRKRESNEDNFLLDAGQGVFAVADGMGGHAAGEVASDLAIVTLRDSLSRKGWNGDADADDASRHLEEALLEANQKICDSILAHAEQRGMGTTVVAMLAAGEDAVIGHVGDSRAYLLRGNDLRRLTSDHSWVNEQVKMGLLTDDAAQRHPMRNIVTRALGSRTEVDIDVTVESISSGDLFLLCSDGLNTMLTDEEIRGTLIENRGDPEAACRALVVAANERGGEDNTTVIVVAIP